MVSPAGHQIAVMVGVDGVVLGAVDRTDDVGELARTTTTITAASAASPPPAMTRALRRVPGLVGRPASSCGSGIAPRDSPGIVAAAGRVYVTGGGQSYGGLGH